MVAAMSCAHDGAVLHRLALPSATQTCWFPLLRTRPLDGTEPSVTPRLDALRAVTADGEAIKMVPVVVPNGDLDRHFVFSVPVEHAPTIGPLSWLLDDGSSWPDAITVVELSCHGGDRVWVTARFHEEIVLPSVPMEPA